MDFLKEKWVSDGCIKYSQIDYDAEDNERLEDALKALNRTLDEIKNKTLKHIDNNNQ